jgi:Concanavalin A-like lectin/glucanases superfamily
MAIGAKVLLSMLLALGAALGIAQGQLASPFSQSVWPSQSFTASNQTGATIHLNNLTSSTSTVGTSFSSGTITLTGSSLTTATFSVYGSSDNGATFYALPVYTLSAPGTTPTLTVTATSNGIYQVSLAGITHISLRTSGTFTATSVSLTFTASPNASVSRNSSSGSAPSGAGNLVYATPCGSAGSAGLRKICTGDLPGVFSANVVYASQVSGATGGQAVAAGSSSTGDPDSAAALNTVLAAGNTALVLDSGFALSTTLLEYSGDTILCTSRANGLIMLPSANATVVANAHQNAPTTTSGTGGYLPSNITDSNISVTGCTLNANSTQAVTGSNNLGVNHTVNPSTGLFVTGTFFDGVQNLNFTNNEVFDAGVWSVFGSNLLYANISNNFIHLPTPITHEKYTDGIHIIGPASNVFENSNTIQAGDDSLALNAEDGNRPGSGDANGPYAAWLGVKWGPIVHVHLDNNVLLNGFFGVRLLSNSELIDDVSVTNTTGNLCGNTFTMEAAYATAFGNGNVGTVTVDGWNVPTTGACNDYAQPYNFVITENYQSISLSHINLSPGIYWPVITHNVVSPGILNLDHWNINSPSSTGFNLVSFTGGAAPLVSASGINWNDNASNTGAAFAGSVVPSIITVSNYAGPNRLLASGYSPAVKNGDAFTNTYNLIPAAIHFWPMNEGSGSTFVDHIGSTNLTASNVTWSTTSGMGTPAVAQFNGTTSYAAAGSVDSTLNFNGSQAMTVCYWATNPTPSNATVIGNLETSSSYQGWEAGLSSNYPAFLVVGAVTSNQLTVVGTVQATAGAQMYCWTYNGNLSYTGVNLYANGASESTVVNTGTLTSGSTSTSPVFVGARNNSTNPYGGAIAYLRVWNTALTSGQIAALYALGPQ